NQSTITRKVTVRTNDKPIIRGVVDVVINEGQPFDAMEGIIAIDSEDGDLSKEVKIEAHVDHEVHGKYNLIYSVADRDGNKTIANRVINVRSNEKPIIRGAENITIKVGDVFDSKLGVVAVDKENKDLTDEIKIVGNVNNNIVGEYNVVYSVVDKNGNENTITRLVKVKNIEDPVIIGKDNVKIKVGEKFDEKAGIIAVDKDNKDLTEKIEVKGSVDSNTVGNYSVTYVVEDENNNKTIAERQITVIKDDFPVIEGAEKVLIKNSEEFNPLQGVVVKDKKDGEITSLIKVDGMVNNKVNGKYKLNYSVKNKSGNETIVSREVIVGDDLNITDEGVIIKNEVLKEEYKNEENNEKPIKAVATIGVLGAAILAAVVSIFKIKKK
ncbi:MAG: immunoglobulin-like domain-containing protein, partial [Sarcina sp.]